MKVKKNINKIKNSTNLSIQVESVTQQEIFDYDENRIVKALVVEANCPLDIAEDVANTVTEKLQATGLTTLTPDLIRNFVNVVLCEKNYSKELKSNSQITLSTSDIESYIFNKDKNNGNTPHNPESVNLSIAENVIKQYALKKIVPSEISKKHLKGDIHIHDLGMLNRLYCSGHSPEYIKRNGIKGMSNIPCTSSPANSAWVASRHLASATLFFTSIFAGAM